MFPWLPSFPVCKRKVYSAGTVTGILKKSPPLIVVTDMDLPEVIHGQGGAFAGISAVVDGVGGPGTGTVGGVFQLVIRPAAAVGVTDMSVSGRVKPDRGISA